MELKDAIAGRKSIRAYKPDPVPRKLIDQVLDAAVKAPSNSNRQPWEFIVVTGKMLKQLVLRLESSAGQGSREARELKTWDDNWPMPEDGRRRANELMRGLLESAQKDGVAPAEFIRSNFRFFGAPCVIVVLMDKGYGHGSLVSVGAAIENMLLRAHDLGLGGYWMMIPLERGEAFKELLEIPDRKILVTTVALGYAMPSNINEFKSGRESKNKVVRFLD